MTLNMASRSLFYSMPGQSVQCCNSAMHCGKEYPRGMLVQCIVRGFSKSHSGIFCKLHIVFYILAESVGTVSMLLNTAP